MLSPRVCADSRHVDGAAWPEAQAGEVSPLRTRPPHLCFQASDRTRWQAHSCGGALQTDTYGPNYKYFSNWPKLKQTGDGALAVDSIEVTLQGRAGLESIEDLGPAASIDSQRGFGLSREDLSEGGPAEVKSAKKRKDDKGQMYYEW
jgi:hypothetical protein